MTDTRVEKRIPNWSIKLNRAQNESCLPSQTRIGSSLSASRPHRRSSVPSSMPASLPQIMISTHIPLKMHTPINIKLSLSNLTRTLPTQKTRRFSDQPIRKSSSLYSANTRVHILLGKRGRREIKKREEKEERSTWATKLLTTRPSSMHMRGPYVLKILAILTCTQTHTERHALDPHPSIL